MPGHSLRRKSPAPPPILRRAIQPILGSEGKRGGIQSHPLTMTSAGNQYQAWKQEGKGGGHTRNYLLF